MLTCLHISDGDVYETYPPGYHDHHQWASEHYWDCFETGVKEVERFRPPASRFSQGVVDHLANGPLLAQLSSTERLLCDLRAALPADILRFIYEVKLTQEAKQVDYAKSLALAMANEGFVFLPSKYYPCPIDPDLQSTWQLFTDHIWWGYLRVTEEDAQHVCWLVPPLPAIVRDCLVHYHVQLGVLLVDLYPLVVIELQHLSASVTDSRCNCLVQGDYDWDQLCMADHMQVDAPAGAAAGGAPAAEEHANAAAEQAAAEADNALAAGKDELSGDEYAEDEAPSLSTGVPKAYIDKTTSLFTDISDALKTVTTTFTAVVSNHPPAGAPLPANPPDPKPASVGSLMHKPDLYTGEDPKIDVRQWLKLVARVGARLSAQELLALCASSLRGRAAKLYEASLEGKEHSFADVSALLIGNYGEKNPEYHARCNALDLVMSNGDLASYTSEFLGFKALCIEEPISEADAILFYHRGLTKSLRDALVMDPKTRS